MICDMTHDMWHVTHRGWWILSHNILKSLAITVCDLWYFEDLEEKDPLISQLINHKVICRTAAATTGLLYIIIIFEIIVAWEK